MRITFGGRRARRPVVRLRAAAGEECGGRGSVRDPIGSKSARSAGETARSCARGRLLTRLPPRGDEHPVRIFRDPPILPRGPSFGVRVADRARATGRATRRQRPGGATWRPRGLRAVAGQRDRREVGQRQRDERHHDTRRDIGRDRRAQHPDVADEREQRVGENPPNTPNITTFATAYRQENADGTDNVTRRRAAGRSPAARARHVRTPRPGRRT